MISLSLLQIVHILALSFSTSRLNTFSNKTLIKSVVKFEFSLYYGIILPTFVIIFQTIINLNFKFKAFTNYSKISQNASFNYLKIAITHSVILRFLLNSNTQSKNFIFFRKAFLKFLYIQFSNFRFIINFMISLSLLQFFYFLSLRFRILYFSLKGFLKTSSYFIFSLHIFIFPSFLAFIYNFKWNSYSNSFKTSIFTKNFRIISQTYTFTYPLFMLSIISLKFTQSQF